MEAFSLTILHIVNGDSVANKLKELDLDGEILVWHESLYEGPVIRDLANKKARSRRAEYFAQTIGLAESLYIQDQDEQFNRLEQHGHFEEVVLWFEHDLFDQVMLIYLLDWFSSYKAPQTKLKLLCIGTFPGIEVFMGLGQLNSSQLGSLVGSWHDVTEDELALASKVWQAYASTDPTQVEKLLLEDLSPLPFLKEALLCHLGRFPSTRNGLGRVEQKTLQLISNGVSNAIELFKKVSLTEINYGLGDLQYWRYLERLRSGKFPLIHCDEPASLLGIHASGAIDLDKLWIELTVHGEAVLILKADWITLNGVAPRWLGGVLLAYDTPLWRWDEETATLQKQQNPL
jgi:hypothetical protein